MKTYPQQIQDLVLKSITREELVAIAKVVGVPVGKNKKNTIAAIQGELNKGTITLKVVSHLQMQKDGINQTLFMKTLSRTEKV